MAITVGFHNILASKTSMSSYTASYSTLPSVGDYVIAIAGVQANLTGITIGNDTAGNSFTLIQTASANGTSIAMFGAKINTAPTGSTYGYTFTFGGSSSANVFEIIILKGSGITYAGQGGAISESASTYSFASATAIGSFAIQAGTSNKAGYGVISTTGATTVDNTSTSGSGASSNLGMVVGSIPLTAGTSYTVSYSSLATNYNALVYAEFKESVSVDTTPPANPSGFTGSATGTTTINLSWTNATDSDFNGTKLYRNGTLVATNSNTTVSYSDTGLTANTTYTYKLTSIDTTGNESTGSTLNVTTLTPADTTPPANVTNLAETNTDTTANLTWTNPTDSDFSKTNVYRNNVLLGNTTSGTYADSGLTGSTTYTYKVTSVDITGNESTGSSITVTTNATTQQQTSVAPSTPINLFPFNGSAWTKLHFEADVTDTDSTSLTFYVDYSTDSTLATGVTTLSAPVTLSSVGATSRASITSANTVVESTVYYWRAYVSDGTSQSATTSIFNFTAKFASGDNMVADGTPFMQQGNPSIHGVIVDINSANDTAINFTTMKNSSLKACYVRCYGHDGTMDVNFVTWAQQAKTAGVPTGGYYYATPSSPTLDLNDARTQAERFASGLQQGYGTGQYGDLLPMLDLEDNSSYATAGQATVNMTVTDFLSWANEFRNHFESVTGRKLGVYTDNYFVRNQMNNFNCDPTTGQPLVGTAGNPIVDMPLWCAGFDYYPRYLGSVMPVMGGWTKWYAFQHSDKGTASTYGVTASNSNIDTSWCEPIDYLEPPKATTGVVALGNGSNVDLTWNTTTELDVHEWDIYVDGTKVGTSNTDGSYTITNLAGGNHTIEVRPIDMFGDDPITTANTISYTINLATPNINVISVNHYTVSNETGFTSTDIVFSFDEDVTSWTVNVLGASYDTGTVAVSGNGGGSTPTTVSTASTWTVSVMATKTVGNIVGGSNVITAGTQITATIDWTKLYQEGQNKVNIYGQNTTGQWTPYQS